MQVLLTAAPPLAQESGEPRPTKKLVDGLTDLAERVPARGLVAAPSVGGGDDKWTMIARGRLADARRWFDILGWEQLPQSQRGRNILRWGSDHAWMANPAHPKRSVRNWCSCWDRTLTVSELDQIVADTGHSNKRWTPDQSATILGIGVRDRAAHRLWFNGADDDLNYDIRRETQREKNAARKRKSRAKYSTGAKPGRPKSEGPPAWQIAGFKSERTYYRHKAAANGPHDTVAPNGSETPSRHLVSKNRKRDAISLPNDIVPAVAAPLPLPAVITAPVVDSGAPKASPRVAPLADDVQDLVKIERKSGVGFAGATPPLSHHLERVLREFGRIQ
jgi:hypothetical protein